MFRIAWSFILVFALFQQGLAAEHIKEYYQEPDLHRFKSNMGTKDFETIDPFTGLLRLNYVDVSIPGTNGLDINVHRVYNNPPGAPVKRELSPIGLGWLMHQGRVVYHASDLDLNANDRVRVICDQISSPTSGDQSIQNNPVFEEANGTRHLFFRTQVTNTGTGTSYDQYISKTNWRFSCEGEDYVITAPNGTKYYATQISNSIGQTILYWYVTSIVDTHNNRLDIEYIPLYQISRIPYFGIKRITSSDGREVVFNYEDVDTRLARLANIDAVESDGFIRRWIYEHAPLGKQYNDYNLLSSVQDPENNFWRYDYWELSRHSIDPDNGDATLYQFAGSLRQVHLPFLGGGYICYQYDFVNILPEYGNIVVTNTNSVKRKTLFPGTCPLDNLNLTSEDPSSQWNFTYDRFHANSVDQTIIDQPFPLGRIEYDYIGASYYTTLNGNLWSLGLQVEKRTYGQGGQLMEVIQTDWQPREIGIENYVRVSGASITSDNAVYAADIKEQRIIRTFDTLNYAGGVHTTTYGDFTVFGNPRMVSETERNTVGATGDIRTTQYTYVDILDKWILNLVETETLQGVGEISRTYNVNGDLRTETRYGVTTTQDYHSATGDLAYITDAENNTTYYEDYKLGIPQTERHPESIFINRTVTDRGTIGTATNGRGKTTTYQYDGLNRINGITLPKVGTLPVTVEWNTSYYDSVSERDIVGNVITRGNYQNIQEIDSLGRIVTNIHRDLTDLTKDIVVTFKYDILDRKTFESDPNSTLGTAYDYDVLNRITKITFTDGSTIENTYYIDNKVDIKDQNGKITTKYYRAYGSPSNSVLVRIESREDVITTIDRNEIDQPLRIWQGNSAGQGAERIYTYYPTTFLETVTNPENGVTTYTYDNVGNVKSESINNRLLKTYNYDGTNKLTEIVPDNYTQIKFGYDNNGNISYSYVRDTLYNTYGSYNNYYYDDNDNPWYTTYQIKDSDYRVDYDFNDMDNLNILTYPSGQQVTYNPDVFGRPGTALPFVNSVYYYPSGQLEQVAYNNGIVTDFTLDDRLRVATIKTGVLTQSPIGDLTYGYDFANNVMSITNGIDPQYNRSMTYDDVNRLKTADGVWGTGSFDYDSLGNLRSKTINGVTTTIDIDTTGVRPEGVYDFRGNKTNFTGLQNGRYDNLNQLRSTYLNLTGLPEGTEYFVKNNYMDYDANGMRVRKQVRGNNFGETVLLPLTDTHYVYEGNNLLGEYPVDPQYGTEHYYLGSKRIASQHEEAPPSINVTAPSTANEKEVVILDASATVDYDSEIIASYSWVQTGGPIVNLLGANTSIAQFYTSNLAQNEVLTFELTVTDEEGNTSTYIMTVTITDVVIVPAPVADVTAVQGDRQNTLNWTAENAMSYDLYWSTSPDVSVSTGTLIPNVSPPFVHAGLTNGTTYYYVMTATDNHGTSDASNVVSATPGVSGWSGGWDNVWVSEIDSTVSYSLKNLFTTNTGSKLALLLDASGSSNVYYFSEFTDGQGWSRPQLIPELSGSSVKFVQVSKDGSRAVLIAYKNKQYWSSIYTTQGGMEPLKNLGYIDKNETGFPPSRSFQATFNTNGDALLACNYGYNVSDGFGFSIKRHEKILTRYSRNTDSWSENSTLSFQGYTKIILTESGDAYYGISHLVGNSGTFSTSVYAYDQSSGSWNQEINHTRNGYSSEFYLLQDDLDNVMLVWSNQFLSGVPNSTSRPSVNVAVKRSGDIDWQQPVGFVDGQLDDYLELKSASYVGSGNLLLVWDKQYNGGNSPAGQVLRSRIYNLQTGWQTIETIAEPNVSEGIIQPLYDQNNKPGFYVKHSDNSVSVFWLQGQDSGYTGYTRKASTIFTRKYTPGSGWSAKTSVGIDIDPNDYFLDKSINGNILLVAEKEGLPVNGQSRNQVGIYIYINGIGWLPQTSYELSPDRYGSVLSLGITDSGNAFIQETYGLIKEQRFSNLGAGLSLQNARPVAFINNWGGTNIAAGQTRAISTTDSLDPDGSIASYSWTLLDDPSLSDPTTISIADPASSNTTASYLSGTQYRDLLLTVTDDSGQSAHDLVTIKLGNAGPRANAGPDQIVSEGQIVVLDASGSSDFEGDTISYLWQQVLGPTVLITNSALAQASFTAPQVDQETVLTFVVRAGSDYDVVAVTVRDNGGQSTIPIANAGPDQTVIEAVRVDLDATASYDPDGTIVSWDWVQTAGPVVYFLNGPGPAQPYFYAPEVFAETILAFSVVATDNDGNTANDMVYITVQDQGTPDTTPPVVTPPANNTTEATATLTTVALGAASANDDTDGALTPSPDQTGPFPFGVTTITWSATDAAGNTGTATQTVTITDTTPPGLTVPANITVTSAVPLAVDIGTATATDIFTPINISNDAPALFPVGTTSVTWTATDANGVSAAATQTVTVDSSPNQLPVANAGPDQTVAEFATVNLTALASNDPDGSIVAYQWTQTAGPIVTLNNANTATPNFSAPDVLTDTVLTFSVVVTDDRGDTANDSILVTVQNVASVADLTISASSSTTTIELDVSFSVSWTVLNQGSGTVGASYTGVYISTDPTFSTNDVQLTQRWIPSMASGASNSQTVSPTVRTTLGLSPGNYYLLAVADKNNNVAEDNETNNTVAIAITIAGDPPANQSPLANAGPDQTVSEGSVVNLNGSGSNDSDGTISSYAWSQTAGPAVSLTNANTATPSFSAPEVTANTLLSFNLVVADDQGATGTDSVSITVQDIAVVDTTPPVVTPPANITTEATAGLTNVILGTASANDDTDGPLTPTANQTGPFPLGSTTVTWSATDTAGNTGTATQTVTITDTTSPVLTVPANITVSSDVPLSIDIGNATATDIFTPINIVNDAPALFPVGVTTVTWTATDANGQSATGTQTVTVDASPNQLPIANAGPDQIVAEFATVNLTASASNDPDGSIVAYQWTQTAGPIVTLNNANTATPSFTAPDVLTDTVLTFSVVVTDDRGDTANDGVLITVQNVASVADLTISASSSTTTMQMDVSFKVSWTVLNQGTGTVGASYTGVYVSTDPTFSSDDVYLTQRWTPSLASGASNSQTVSPTIRSSLGLSPGSYYLLVVADKSDNVAEDNENNNTVAIAITVTAP